MAGIYSAVAMKCIYTHYLPLVCIISGGVHLSWAGFKWHPHARGIQKKQCMHILNEIRKACACP